MFRFLRRGGRGKSDPGRPPVPPKDPVPPDPSRKDPVVDVQGMIQQASNRVEVQKLLKKGKKDIALLSREKIEELINRSVQMAVERHRADGAKQEATVSQLQAESRAHFDELLRRATQTAASSEDPAPAILELIRSFAAEQPAAKDARVALDQEAERRILPFDKMELAEGRGLSVGTVSICAGAASSDASSRVFNIHRNAFLDVRRDALTHRMLSRFGIRYLARGENTYIVGDAAFNLANLFEKNLRRPMKDGTISPDEPEALFIVNHLVSELLGRPQKAGEICVYSIPADSVDADRNLIYHRAALEGVIRNLGYAPKAMLEGHLIVFSELKNRGYTGIGISCGGGMFNVCLAFKGVPVFTFSTSRGGDWIDTCAAEAIGLPVPLVSAVKEGGMNLLHPKGRVEEAIAIHYRHLLQYTLEMMRQEMGEGHNVSLFADPIDIVCAGGSSRTQGFIDLFREEFRKVGLPIRIADVRLATEPTTAVAAGCVQAAIEETRALSEGIHTGPAALERAAATISPRNNAAPQAPPAPPSGNSLQPPAPPSP